MKKATINISDVKYFADEHELHIFGEINVDHVVLDFGLTQSVLGSELRAEYEDVCLCYEVGMPPEFYYDENGKNAANIDEKVKSAVKSSSVAFISIFSMLRMMQLWTTRSS